MIKFCIDQTHLNKFHLQYVQPIILSLSFGDKIKTLRLNLLFININPFSVPDKSPPIVSSFKPATFDETQQLILSSPTSTCQTDPIPSNLLPHCIYSILPIFTRIVNLSLNTGTFPNEFKSAFVKPLQKKQIWIQII